MEKEPKTEEEFNAAKIQIGDDMKARLKMDERRKNDTISLVRVRSLAELDYHPDDENAEDDFELYERDEDKCLRHIFLKTMNDSRRVYIDHDPAFLNHAGCMELSERHYEKMQERHDDRNTEYLNYGEEVDRFLKEHKIYQEV